MRIAALCIGFLVVASLACAQTPIINAGGILNSGSYSTQGVAPGSIVSIFGTNLAGTMSSASSVPLSTSLGDVTSVTFNGIPAALFYAAGPQINAQIPWNVLPAGTTSGTANVVVTRSVGSPSVPQTVAVLPSVPGIFTVTSNGLGQAYAYDNTTGAVPAPVGTVIGNFKIAPFSLSSGHPLIIFCTGLGPVSPPIDNGKAASDGVLRNVLPDNYPDVLIGGVKATRINLGVVLSPQFVSEYQVAVFPAANTPTGDTVSVQLQVNGILTTDKATIAIAQ